MDFIKYFRHLLGKSEEDRASVLEDRYSHTLLDELSDKDVDSVIKSGEEFLEKTELIRIDQYYKWKEDILSDPGLKDFDARSMNYMLDQVFNFDRLLIESLKTKEKLVD